MNAIDFLNSFDTEEAAQKHADSLAESVVLIHIDGKWAVASRGAVCMMHDALGDGWILQESEERCE